VVKLEGAGTSVSRARAIVQAGIPVMGHIGLRRSRRPCSAVSRPRQDGRSRARTGE